MVAGSGANGGVLDEGEIGRTVSPPRRHAFASLAHV